MSRAVLLFARSPRAESSAKRLGHRNGERLFEGIARSWMRAARQSGAALLVACAPEHRQAFLSIGEVDAFVDQLGSSFGERLAGAAEAAFASGPVSLLVTGIDAPPPEAALLDSAFAAIERNAAPAVVAPSSDGGVNFLIIKAADAGLLRGFRPRDVGLLARCRRYFSDRLIEFAPASDLDSPAILRTLLREELWRPYRWLLRIEPQAHHPRLAPELRSFRCAPSRFRAPPAVAL